MLENKKMVDFIKVVSCETINNCQEFQEEIDVFKYYENKQVIKGLSIAKLIRYCQLENSMFFDENNFIYIWNGKYWEISDVKKYLTDRFEKDVHISDYFCKEFKYNFLIFSKLKKRNSDFNCKNKLVFKNGTLDYKNCIFYENGFNKEDYCTIFVNHNFDINADYTSWNFFKNMLHEYLEDEKDILKLQIMLGFAISSQVSQGAFFLKGQYNLIKIFFEYAIKTLLNDTSYIANTKIEDFIKYPRFVKKDFFNKTICFFGNLSNTKAEIFRPIRPLLEDNIHVQTEQRWKNECLHYKNTCTYVFTCNEISKDYYEDNSTFNNRKIIIPLNSTIVSDNEVEEANIKKQIENNISELISFAVIGLCAFMQKIYIEIK